MKKKFLKLLSAALIGTMALTGCAGSSSSATSGENTSVSTQKPAEENKIARLVSGGEPGSLHPALSQGTHESIILDHVFEGLMKRDDKEQIVPGMAESYEISDDHLTYTFKLRDAKWSNGDPVTAGDFEYAWKYALNPNTGSNYAYQLYYLEGAEAFNSADPKTADLAALEAAVGVKALDDKTLEVKLASPTAYFLELCAFYTYYPINKKVQEANADWANDGTTFVSNGPFSVVAWNHDESVEVAKNENYYNKDAVKLDGITFYISEDLNTNWQMYQNDEIDLNHDIPTDVLGQLRAENNAELATKPELATYYYRFNTTKKPLTNVKVRKALSMAIDRDLIIEAVAQGGQFPAYAYVPSGIQDADGKEFRANGGDYFKYDVEAAKKLLAEGLAEEGVSSLEFSILYNTSESHKKIAEAIQQMWKDNLGVNVTLENTEFKVKIDREHALDYDVSRSGWVGDYVDPNTFLDLFTSWSTQNDTGWTSPEYDELISKAAVETDPAVRMNYLHEAETLLMEASPIMPIYFYTKNYVTKPYLVGVYKPVNREVCLIYADIVK